MLRSREPRVGRPVPRSKPTGFFAQGGAAAKGDAPPWWDCRAGWNEGPGGSGSPKDRGMGERVGLSAQAARDVKISCGFSRRRTRRRRHGRGYALLDGALALTLGPGRGVAARGRPDGESADGEPQPEARDTGVHARRSGFAVRVFCSSWRGMAGVQTRGLEIAEALAVRRFSILSPVGRAGLTLAVARGCSPSRDISHPT